MADRKVLKDRIAANRAARFADGGDVYDPQTQSGMSIDPSLGERTLQQVQQATDITGNLAKSDAIANAAAHGDQDAQLVLANQQAAMASGSLGEADGLVQQARSVLGHPISPSYMDRLPAAQRLVSDIPAAIEAGTLHSGHLEAAESNLRSAMNNADRMKAQKGRKGYADGGVAASSSPDAPPGIDEFLASPDAGRAPASAAPAGMDDFIKDDVQQQKYGTAGQMLKTAGEHALQGFAGPAGTAALRAFGDDPKEMQARTEANPGIAGASEVGAFAGSALTGVGEAALLGDLGKAVEAGSTLSKIGSKATSMAIENMAYQAGDEANKMLLKDPNQSVQTAAVDMGLSGIIGAGIGGAAGKLPSLFHASAGKEAGGVLSAVARHVGGIESAIPDSVTDAIDRLGIEIAPEMKAQLSANPSVRQAAQILNDSATGSGIKFQEGSKAFKGQLSEAALNAVGKTSEDLGGLSELSEHATGDSIKKDITDQIKQRYAPIAESYDRISNAFKGTELTALDKGALAEKVALAIDAGTSPSSPAAGLVQRVLREIPDIKNLEQLRNYASGIGGETSGIAKQELWDVGKKLRTAFGDATDGALNAAVAEKAPALLAEHKATTAAYKDLRGVIGDLNDRLHVGPHAGPKTFLTALNGMDGESVLRRLSPAGRADIIKELSEKFPSVADKVREFHLDKAVKQAMKYPADGEMISSKALFKTLSGMAPEMREFILPKGASEKIGAIQHLISQIPDKIGKSGTPQGLDGLMKYVPQSAIGLASMLTGHGAAASFLYGKMAGVLGRDAPDAIRLGLLKFLGSDKEISGKGFKAAVEFMHATMKGESALNRAVSDVLKPVVGGSLKHLDKDMSDHKKLDERLQHLNQNPSAMLDTGKDTGHYLPDHGAAMGQLAATAVTYLNSIRPGTKTLSPLDRPIPPSSQEKYNYNAALSVAQRPTLVLDKIRNGTLTPLYIKHLNAMYPQLYQQMQSRLHEQIISQTAKGQSIPYSTRLQLAMFLGQPLDSTMTPAAISTVQSQGAAKGQQPQDAPSVKGNTSKLSGIAKSAQTAGQERQAARAGQQKD